MRMNSIGMLGRLPRFAVVLACVLALGAGVASTGLTTADRTDPAQVLARAAGPNIEGAVPPHTIGLTADYFAAIGISEAVDRSPEVASPATPSTAAPERLARRRPDAASSDTPLAKGRVCGDSSVSLAAAKAPPTTES